MFKIFPIQISRPKFWLYTAGPFAVGYALGLDTPARLLSFQFWIYLLYFLIPANIFLYGINDYYDTDTDQYNTKKGKEEHRLLTHQHHTLARILIGSLGVSLLILFLSPDWLAACLFILFIFLSYAYSAPPIRFKARPYLDSISNILYALPGFLGYYLASDILPDISIVIAAWTWCTAMHLFSAIPDIQPDQQAGLTTTAIKLGYKKSLLLCSLLWLISFLALPSQYIFLLALIYPLLPLLPLLTRVDINQLYWMFPYVTGILGTILWWQHAWHWL